MPSVTFNEFKRELDKRIKDPQVAYMFALLYERFADVMKGQEETAKVCVALANSMQGLVKLNEVTERRMRQLAKTGMINDGADIASVMIDPEEPKKN